MVCIHHYDSGIHLCWIPAPAEWLNALRLEKPVPPRLPLPKHPVVFLWKAPYGAIGNRRMDMRTSKTPIATGRRKDRPFGKPAKVFPLNTFLHFFINSVRLRVLGVLSGKTKKRQTKPNHLRIRHNTMPQKEIRRLVITNLRTLLRVNSVGRVSLAHSFRAGPNGDPRLPATTRHGEVNSFGLVSLAYSRSLAYLLAGWCPSLARRAGIPCLLAHSLTCLLVPSPATACPGERG